MLTCATDINNESSSTTRHEGRASHSLRTSTHRSRLSPDLSKDTLEINGEKQIWKANGVGVDDNVIWNSSAVVLHVEGALPTTFYGEPDLVSTTQLPPRLMYLTPY